LDRRNQEGVAWRRRICPQAHRPIALRRCAKAEPLHPRQHLGAEEREIVDVVDEADRHAVEPGIAQELEGVGDMVGIVVVGMLALIRSA